jgi:hypothetical protein
MKTHINSTIMKKILLVLALVTTAMTMAAQENVSTTSTNEPILIERIGNTYFYNNQAMTQKECDAFLAQNNMPIYKEFHSGYQLQKTGWTLLGVGLGLDCLGMGLAIGSIFAQDELAFVAMLGIGVTSLTVASCCEIACIPVLAIGYTRMHDSVDYYYIGQKSKQQSLSLNLTASQNGIGLALNF